MAEKRFGKRDPRHMIRLGLVLVFTFVLGGLASLIIGLLSTGAVNWGAIFPVATLAGILGFLLLAWVERGFLYFIIASVVIAIASGLTLGQGGGKIVQMLGFLAVELLFASLMMFGDRLGRLNQLLRWIFASLGGVVAGGALLLISGLLYPGAGGIGNVLVMGAGTVAVVVLSASTGVMLIRLILGDPKKPTPVKMEKEE